MLHCERCARDVEPVRGSRLWWGVIVLGWVVFFALAPFWAIMLPLNVLFIPLFSFGMMHFVGYASARANEPPRCPSCETDLSAAPDVAKPVTAVVEVSAA